MYCLATTSPNKKPNPGVSVFALCQGPVACSQGTSRGAGAIMILCLWQWSLDVCPLSLQNKAGKDSNELDGTTAYWYVESPFWNIYGCQNGRYLYSKEVLPIEILEMVMRTQGPIIFKRYFTRLF